MTDTLPPQMPPLSSSAQREVSKGVDLSRSRLEMLIDEHIFSEKDRSILKRRWFDNITYAALGEEFRMSPRQIPRIVERCEMMLVRFI
jgi:hypothetical protein